MSNEAFELDGIGEFRARAGTATAELAGAAKYWSDRAKKAERVNAREYGRGFTHACLISAVSGGLVVSIIHFFGWL